MTTNTMKTYRIEETCTYEIEAESLDAAKSIWLEHSDFEFMQRCFDAVIARSIQTLDADGVPEEDDQEF